MATPNVTSSTPIYRHQLEDGTTFFAPDPQFEGQAPIVIRQPQPDGTSAGTGSAADGFGFAPPPDDAPDVPADLEGALGARYAQRDMNEARFALSQMLPEPAGKPETAQPLGGSKPRPAPEPEAGTTGQGGQQQQPPPRRSLMPSPLRALSVLAPAASDLAQGVRETPKQVVGGARDAAQATSDLATWAGEAIAQSGVNVAATPGIGPLATALVAHAAATRVTAAKLPDVGKAKSVTGAVVRGIAEFVAGFVAGGPLVKAAGVAKNTFTAAAIRGALADFVGFPGHEANLAKLLRDHAGLADPVTAFLATDPADNEAVNRLRRSLEGFALGTLVEGFVRALRYMRSGRSAGAGEAGEQGVPGATADSASAAPQREPAPMLLLGDDTAHAPLTTRGRAPLPAAGRPSTPTETGVPADVTARALTPEGATPPGMSFRSGEGFAPQFGAGEELHPAIATFTRGGGFRPVLGEGEQAVYVNWARVESEADVKRIMADLLKAFPDDIAQARRVVRRDVDVRQQAASTDAFDALLTRRTGQPLTDTETLAARALWEGAAEHLMDVATIAVRTGSPEAQAQMLRMLDVVRGIQAMLLGARADAARSLRAWGVSHGQDVTARMHALDSVIATNGGPDATAALAVRIAGLRNLPEFAGDVARFAEKTRFAKTTAAITQVWMNFLLSGPLTHIRNLVGNTGAMTLGWVEAAVARRWSQLLGSGEVQPGEAAAVAFGQMMAIRQAWRMFSMTAGTGESQFARARTQLSEFGRENALSSQYWNLRHDSLMGAAVDTLGSLVNIPGRLMLASDDFFKMIAFGGEQARQAHRIAQREVAQGTLTQKDFDARVAAIIAEGRADVTGAAERTAHYQTFTDQPGMLVEAIGRLDRAMANSPHPLGNFGALAMRMIIPFRNTPARLMNYTFERTPLAPLTNTYREAIAAGGAAADIARARMALGSFALLGLIDLALDGQLTGAGPSTRKSGERGTRETAFRAGWRPYSVRAGERYYTFSNIDPGGTMLGIAADIAEILRNADFDDQTRAGVHEVVAGATFAFGAQVLDKTWMQGAASLFQTLLREQSGPRFVERIGASLAAPSYSNWLRRQADPVMREVHDMTTRLMDRIPGLSSRLPPARDIWGRERPYAHALGPVANALSPSLATGFKPEPIDREALRFGFNLGMPPRTLRVGNENYPLEHRPEVYARYLELTGQTFPSQMGDVDADRLTPAGYLRAGPLGLTARPRRDLNAAGLLIAKYGDQPLLPLLNAIVEGNHRLSAQYQAADARGKDRLVSGIIADYRRAARGRLFEEFPDLKKRTRGYNWRFPGVEADQSGAGEGDGAPPTFD